MGASKEHFMPGVAQLGKLLRPASIAVIGATDSEGKTGAMITKNLLTGGYAGRVVCINPKRDAVFGAPCYPSLVEADVQADCAIVVVSAAVVEDVIRASAGQCKNFVVIAAGFAESGDEGRAREASLRALADEYQLAIMGPNCLGFITPSLKANASFAPHILADGNVALLSQSGALAVALLDQAAKTMQGFSFVISLGNKMQIDEAAVMAFLAQDRATEVVAMYVEGVTDGARLAAQMRALAGKKPMVVLHGGATAAGQAASASHTGALMQESAVFDAVCEKYGVIRTTTLSEFIDTVNFVRRYGVRSPQNPAVVTNAGGLGVLTTDAFAHAGAPLERIEPGMQAQMAQALPAAASTHNPVDVLGDADGARYSAVYDALNTEHASTDTALSILTPQAQTPVMGIARMIAERVATDEVIHVASFVGGVHTDDAMRFLARSGVPTSATPEAAARMITSVGRAQSDAYIGAHTPDERRIAEGQRIFARMRDEERPSLYYTEVAKLCGAYSIPIAPAWRMDYDSPSSVSFPCVVKVDAPSVLHKTDKGGVIVGVKDGATLNEAIQTMQDRFPGERVIVQPMLDAGVELIIGAKRDPVFGPTVLIGYGGIYAEEIRMTELLVPPFDTKTAENKLIASRLGFLFRETRGQAPYDARSVAHVAAALGEMMIENDWISEIDVNPLFVYNDNRSAIAVDMKVMGEGAER